MFPKEEEIGLVNSMTVSVTNKTFHEIHNILKLYLHEKKKSLKAGAGIVLLLEPHQIFVFQPCLTPLL